MMLQIYCGCGGCVESVLTPTDATKTKRKAFATGVANGLLAILDIAESSPLAPAATALKLLYCICDNCRCNNEAFRRLQERLISFGKILNKAEKVINSKSKFQYDDLELKSSVKDLKSILDTATEELTSYTKIGFVRLFLGSSPKETFDTLDSNLTCRFNVIQSLLNLEGFSMGTQHYDMTCNLQKDVKTVKDLVEVVIAKLGLSTADATDEVLRLDNKFPPVHDVWDCENQIISSNKNSIIYEGKLRGQEVAIKTFHSFNEDSSEVIHREFESVHSAIMSHPGVIQIYGVHLTPTATPRRCIVMELADCSLADVLNNRSHFKLELDVPAKLSILIQVSLIIKSLHDVGVAHKNIKPSNILLFKYSRGIKVKLSELGLSQKIGLMKDDAYMAPEFLKGFLIVFF